MKSVESKTTPKLDDTNVVDPQKEKAPRCACCGTTKNLHRDNGSGGPYRCSSVNCIVF